MIERISTDTLSNIEGLLAYYIKDVQKMSRPIDSLLEWVRNGLEKDQVALFALNDNAGEVVGLSMASLDNPLIRGVFVNPESSVDVQDGEETLLDALLPVVKKNARFVFAWFSPMSRDFKTLLKKKGFTGYDRAAMSATPEQILSLEAPLPDGYRFDTYTSEHRDTAASLMFEANQGTVDFSVFPYLFATLEDSRKMAERVEKNAWGEYKEPHSKVIFHGSELVGFCYVTIRRGETPNGYIPEICTAPAHKRKGLAKAILTYSLQELVKNEPDIERLDLDVTLANPAKRIYDWAGFKKTREYTVFNMLC